MDNVRTYIVKEKLPLLQGLSQSGKEWKNQQVVVEAKENVQYPDTLLLTFNGQHTDLLKSVEVGMEVEVSYSASVRTYTNADGRVFRNQVLNCWKISPVVQTF